MNETVNQVDTVNEDSERTFTQAELDAIVSDRLKRDRAKYADYDTLKEKADKLDALEEASKTELQKANELAATLRAQLDGIKKENEVRALRDKISAETGVPATLLTEETEEKLAEQAKAILSFAKPQGYPNVKDAGEVPHRVGKLSTREQFAEWANQAFNE